MTNEFTAEAMQVTVDLTGVTSHDCVLTPGSGWGDVADLTGETVAEVSAEKTPGFSVNGVVGRRGTLGSIMPESGRALTLGTWTHFYEGKGVDAVAHGVRIATTIGAKVCILTDGCGSTIPEWGPGTMTLIDDHINLTTTPPLRGVNFTGLTSLYSPQLREIVRDVDPGLPEGVCTRFPGPHHGTPAEMRMVKALSTNLVGVSTTLEAIAARAAGVEVLGISLVTSYAAGIAPSALSHNEAPEAERVVSPYTSRLLTDIVRIVGRTSLGVVRPLANTD